MAGANDEPAGRPLEPTQPEDGVMSVFRQSGGNGRADAVAGHISDNGFTCTEKRVGRKLWVICFDKGMLLTVHSIHIPEVNTLRHFSARRALRPFQKSLNSTLDKPTPARRHGLPSQQKTPTSSAHLLSFNNTSNNSFFIGERCVGEPFHRLTFYTTTINITS